MRQATKRPFTPLRFTAEKPKLNVSSEARAASSSRIRDGGRRRYACPPEPQAPEISRSWAPAGRVKPALPRPFFLRPGAIGRQGSVADGTSVGDASPEARARGGSTELNLMHFDYMDDRYVLIDAPGLGRLRRRRHARRGGRRPRHRRRRSRSRPRPARRADAPPARGAGHPAHDLRQQDRPGARLDPGACSRRCSR